MEIKDLKEIFEKNDWNVMGDVVTDGSNSWDLERYSPAGEDFLVTLDFNTVDEAINEFREYVEYFNTDEGKEEHIKTIMNANGAPSLRELVEDADAIAEMLNDTLAAISGNTENKLEEAENDSIDTNIENDNEDTIQIDELLEEFINRNPLYERVVSEIVEDSDGYNGTKTEQIQARLSDISKGLVNGTVSSLIYYTDTVEFFDKYNDEIWDLLESQFGYNDDEVFIVVGDVPKVEIVMGSDRVKNNIVWYVYENIALELDDAITEMKN